MFSTLLSMAALWLRRSSKCFFHLALISVLPFRMDAPSLQRVLSTCGGSVDHFHCVQETSSVIAIFQMLDFTSLFTAGCPLNGSLAFLVGLAFPGRLGDHSGERGTFLVSNRTALESFIVFIKSVVMFLLLATDDFLVLGDDGRF